MGVERPTAEVLDTSLHAMMSAQLNDSACALPSTANVDHDHDGLFSDGISEYFDKLEAAIRKMPPVEMPLSHHFAPGVYVRELTIPAGTILTGKIHLTEHLCVISKGDISVLTESGVKRIKAPCTFLSPPGIKRVGYAHEDTVWSCIHPTHETDLTKLEALLVTDRFDDPRLTELRPSKIGGSS